MTHDLARQLLASAYAIDGATLDQLAQSLGTRNWAELAENLIFDGWDTGGGCLMLVAQTSTGHVVGLTDGEAGFPTTGEHYWLGVMTEIGEEELYAAIFDQGGVEHLL